MANEKIERVKYDRATSKWFKEHPFHQTTVMQWILGGKGYDSIPCYFIKEIE